jgi:Cys-tRNA synthase (O-phospho-L-seryl-tRNA:Cys-tRNA synthase)
VIICDNLWLNSNKNLFNIDSLVKGGLTPAQVGGEIGEFWDTHDLAEYWDQTELAEFEVDPQSEITYYALDSQLSERVQAVAKERGVPANTLLNLLVQAKLSKNTKYLIKSP